MQDLERRKILGGEECLDIHFPLWMIDSELAYVSLTWFASKSTIIVVKEIRCFTLPVFFLSALPRTETQPQDEGLGVD